MSIFRGGAEQRLPAPPSPQGSSAHGDALAAQLPSLRQRLLRHARLAVHDQGLAEDLVQDTLIAVLEQHGGRRGESTLLTWVMAILRNKVADWYRSPTRRRMVQASEEDDALAESLGAAYDEQGRLVEPVPAWQQPERQSEQRQMMLALQNCIGHLPRQTGQVFMMREWIGFETREICERLGISAENCRTIIHRARLSLRACMQRDWIGKEDGK